MDIVLCFSHAASGVGHKDWDKECGKRFCLGPAMCSDVMDFKAEMVAVEPLDVVLEGYGCGYRIIFFLFIPIWAFEISRVGG